MSKKSRALRKWKKLPWYKKLQRKLKASSSLNQVLLQVIGFLYYWNTLNFKFGLKVPTLHSHNQYMTPYKKFKIKFTPGYLREQRKSYDKQIKKMLKEFPVYNRLRIMSKQLDKPGIRKAESRVVKYSRSKWKRTRDKFIDSHEELVCSYCKTDLESGHPDPNRRLTVDHIVPLSKGGAPFSPKNLALCCQSCNQFKGGYLLAA